jgi:uncharacterized protein (TIGR04222 family)
MNPFDLRGPEFLLFYLGLSAATLVALVVVRQIRESSRAVPQPKLSDPYAIAYLRGGGEAAVESAVVSLVDRRILDVAADGLKSRSGLDLPRFDHLERAILKEATSAVAAGSLLKKNFEPLKRYEQLLSSLGLMPDEAERSARVRDTMVAAMLLGAVAGIKIVVALSRGRSNILFLIILAVAALIGVIKLGNPRLTRKGKAVLQDLQTLFSGLRSRADSLAEGRAAAELALLAALFGAVSLPLGAFPMREKLFPLPAANSDGGSSSSGGCGSSSCGGGGCGGGGCGGCGS